MANALLQEVTYLKENGFSEQQASAVLFVQKSHIDTHLATKKDILILEKDIENIRKDVENIRKDMENMRLEAKKDRENMRLTFKKDMENIRSDFKKDMEILKNQLTIRMGSMIFAGFLLLAGYINYLNRDMVQSHLEGIKSQIISALERNQRVISPAPSEQKQSSQADNNNKKIDNKEVQLKR